MSDTAAHGFVAAVNDEATSRCVRAERAFLAGLGADCSVPVAGYATCRGDRLTLRALYYTPEGRELRVEHSGPADTPERVGEQACAMVLRELQPR